MVATVIHPMLHAGLNFDDINGDEADGSGTNWPIWPLLFDTFEGLVPLIITEEMLEPFIVECADIVFPYEDRTINLPFETMLATIPPELATVMIDGESTTVVLPWALRTQAVRSDHGKVKIAGGSGTLALPSEADTGVIRKAS